MRIIQMQQDFLLLGRVGALPLALLDQVEEYFLRLRNELIKTTGDRKQIVSGS